MVLFFLYKLGVMPTCPNGLLASIPTLNNSSTDSRPLWSIVYVSVTKVTMRDEPYNYRE